MTTSGTTSFNATSDQVVTKALQHCGVINTSETVSTADFTLCRTALNLILKNLPIETWLLWCYVDLTIPLVSGTSTYTIGPSGTVSGIRPLRIAKAWLRDTNNNDIPLTQLSRSDYDMLTPKATSGIPCNYYYDPQLVNGNFIIWPVINLTGYTIYVSVQRTMQDISLSDGTQTFDLPQEWLLPLGWILADEISMDYCNNLQKVGLIQQRAEMWRTKMADYSREEVSLYFSPSFQGVGN